MYDGIAADAAAIAKAFPNAEMVGGYVDGKFVWGPAQWGLFPKAKKVLISAIPGSSEAMTADVADCETGDYTPVQAAAWAHAKRAAGYDRPTIYCSLDVTGAVRTATGSLLLGQDYDLWVAHYTGAAHEITFPDGKTAAATQYQSFSFYDISAVYDSGWPHRKAPAVEKQWREWTSAGDYSLNDFAYKVAGKPPSTLLRETAVHYGVFDPILAGYLNELASGKIAATAKLPKGSRFWVYA